MYIVGGLFLCTDDSVRAACRGSSHNAEGVVSERSGVDRLDRYSAQVKGKDRRHEDQDKGSFFSGLPLGPSVSSAIFMQSTT